MTYSRKNPSARYIELVTQYTDIHRDGLPDQQLAGDDVYFGASLLQHLPKVKLLAREVGAKSLLDYGSGKGRYYTAKDIKMPDGTTIPSIKEYLGLDDVHCYDPAVPEHREPPQGTFDIVVSTDALEHCPESDIPWIMDEIFSYARCAVFANVASYPAKKTLPNGENAHATQRMSDWWDELLKGVSAKYPEVRYQFEIVQFEKSLATLFRRRRRVRTVSG
ncbi:class I SAM-dependent methyltransferase [Roseobacter sp. HKCCD9010]|uniref:methyltransferase domain-containing protein n=1 Tax=unclassified Roseobacter TaxID=196798 RepID=UPI001492154B|nr:MULTISPECIES: methyltransferase domain-containing protein [unclassified Roseobacter]MBF9050612.1 class I SAM-dependent methyltransferase [Rhodobacterales bacterium HKCCD4356]NNV11970.1 class I SAM-dependent methyltransferase [Roseobacter sp. HKCCD7357]NNV16983.1 class I SAM-dependent methyltransferase [Roseobacter sp. HKCCD8768]NNV26212.1 class I SAM-dependent methyltransferase [Roseobacter sp. HKCCD8192]NNV30707.1 class I SAM-dependent methyltransferase [Roseobacter sp. HKCCD9061]